MKRLAAFLAAVLAATLLTMAAPTAPASAVGWSPQTCEEHPDKGYRICVSYYVTQAGGTYTTHNVQMCLYGQGTAGPLVHNTYNGRVVIRSSNNTFLGQVYPPNVARGTCEVSAVHAVGGVSMEGVWTGQVNITTFDSTFSMCRKVNNGTACLF